MAKKNQNNDTRDPSVKRLDGLLRLLIELNKSMNESGFTDKKAAQLLQSVGLSPTEIAKVLGKKSATDVSKYLY